MRASYKYYTEKSLVSEVLNNPYNLEAKKELDMRFKSRKESKEFYSTFFLAMIIFCLVLSSS